MFGAAGGAAQATSHVDSQQLSVTHATPARVKLKRFIGMVKVFPFRPRRQ
jgi:hypothetical protein